MAAADALCFTLWISTVVTAVLGCPELCSCFNKNAECSYKDFTEVPGGFPSNVIRLSLTANKISLIPLGSFDNVIQVTSLWLAHNRIVSIEQGTLAPLVHLRNFDINHNKIVDFPWEDLQNLTGLHLLRMDHNEMTHLPRNAFSNLKDLRSLRLDNNRFTTIAEGTFDGLVFLSHLQINNNLFACTCSLDWLRAWISTTTISVLEQNSIVCESPEKLKGEVIGKFPESKCKSPNVTIRTNIHKSTAEGRTLVLTCEFIGNPKPLVLWNIRSRSLKQEVVLSFTEDDSAESEDFALSHHRLKVFNNGTLIIPHLRREDSGNYSCSATNEVGRADDSVSVTVAASPQRTPIAQWTTTPTYIQTRPTTEKIPVSDSDVETQDVMSVEPTVSPTAEMNVPSYDEEPPSRASKCGLTVNTRYISNHVVNGSLDDIKHYTFDFGVIALGVSETEATVRLNPLLIPREKSVNRAAPTSGSLRADSGEGHDLSDVSVHTNGLYLCVSADRKHSAVQWSRIKEGVSTYLFSGLRPGTNYSLCLTYRGEDCEVQVLFATRRRVPNLLIIVSVSICLLTVSTVPLLGATCFHLVYKYRGKTYKLILKAKDQCHMERNLNANFNIRAPHTDSRRKINGSQLDEEEGESVDGVREADTEESVVTESFTLSQCRGNLDDCEVGSEFSDKLPLGAEAVNIMSNYKYPNQ
ncbi:immunoglobulin superfamily containing leucine-rich repeat protein 2-like [Hippoglossus hippoglossus]|uniref:immunoglobulin superfamily containing leucine-rich repeat protein 2-like n=1 Tax=Hippoglossus hippoglossus TaxID=8267 RepID=UPI00148CBEC4|nr:immunoglobulin superfamily containing leucine-rich repeat protein 2-like [Hippoglossus hippoglossus]